VAVRTSSTCCLMRASGSAGKGLPVVVGGGLGFTAVLGGLVESGLQILIFGENTPAH